MIIGDKITVTHSLMVMENLTTKSNTGVGFDLVTVKPENSSDSS